MSQLQSPFIDALCEPDGALKFNQCMLTVMSFRGKYRMPERIVCKSLGHDVCLSPIVSFVDMGPISRHCGRCTRGAIEMQKVLEMLWLFMESREHEGISADDATRLKRIVPFDSKVCGWLRVSEQEEPTHVKSNG